MVNFILENLKIIYYLSSLLIINTNSNNFFVVVSFLREPLFFSVLFCFFLRHLRNKFNLLNFFEIIRDIYYINKIILNYFRKLIIR